MQKSAPQGGDLPHKDYFSFRIKPTWEAGGLREAVMARRNALSASVL